MTERVGEELVEQISGLIVEEVTSLIQNCLPGLVDPQGQGLLEGLERHAQQASARIGQAIIQGVIDAATNQITSRKPDGWAGCGQGHRARLVANRPKQVRTLLGDITLERDYYHCGRCREGFAPFDRLLGVTGTGLSPGLVKAASLSGMSMPFKKGEQFIATVTGISLASAKTIDRATKTEGGRARQMIDATAQAALQGKVTTLLAPPRPDKAYIVVDGTGAPMVPAELSGHRGKSPDGRAHTREVKIGCLFTQTGFNEADEPQQDAGSSSYVASFATCEDFAVEVLAEYLRRGLDQIRQPVLIGDGAKWIWHTIAPRFPHATEIVDYYHASEHIHDLARLLESQLTDRQTWTSQLINHLDQGNTNAIATAVHHLDLPTCAPDLVKPAAREIGYFTTNHHRMQYAHFRQQGYFIGSGFVESACNTLVAQRAKQAGMHWTIKGLDPILALRALHQSGRTNLIWQPTNNQTPLTKAA